MASRPAHYTEGRKCSACAKLIVNLSKTGLCHGCFLKGFNSDPEMRAKRIAGQKRLYRENPEAYAKRVKILNRSREKAFADPVIYAKMQEHGRRLVHHLHTPDAIARKEAARPRMVEGCRAARLSWCPREYWDEYCKLIKGPKRMRAADARPYILQKAADEAALKHIDSALDYLKRLAPVAKLENGYRYGNAILRPSEVIERAKLRGWQPDRWAA